MRDVGKKIKSNSIIYAIKKGTHIEKKKCCRYYIFSGYDPEITIIIQFFFFIFNSKINITLNFMIPYRFVIIYLSISQPILRFAKRRKKKEEKIKSQKPYTIS